MRFLTDTPHSDKIPHTSLARVCCARYCKMYHADSRITQWCIVVCNAVFMFVRVGIMHNTCCKDFSNHGNCSITPPIARTCGLP
jgi:hypothetical protein